MGDDIHTIGARVTGRRLTGWREPRSVKAGGEYEFLTTDSFTVETGEHTISSVATTFEGDNTGFVDAVKVIAAE